MIGRLDPTVEGRRLMLRLVGQACGEVVPHPSVEPPALRRILAIRPDHLGDVLFLTPALRYLRETFPSSEIIVLVGPWSAPVLRSSPCIDRLLTWDFPWFNRRPKSSLFEPYQSLAELASTLRGLDVECALIFRSDFWWGALATHLAGIPIRIGYSTAETRPFLTRALPVVHGRHAVVDNLALAAAITGQEAALAESAADLSNFPPSTGGLKHDGSPTGSLHLQAPQRRLEFIPTDADRSAARTLLGEFSDAQPLVALQTGAGAAVKVWPPDRLAVVATVLREQCNASFVAVGGRDDRAGGAVVKSALGSACLDLTSQTTIGELGAILEQCALVVGPDSGPLHLAVAVGTPTVHIFGPADPARFGPYGDPRRHRVVLSPRSCAPCGRLDFSPTDVLAHNCLHDVQPEAIIREALTLLQ